MPPFSPFSIRQAIVQFCCASRDAPQLLPSGAAGGSRRLRRHYTSGKEEVSIFIDYTSSGGDADDFDRAFRDDDLRALVGLLSSNQAVEQLFVPKHPWAKDPCTVGALAAMQLALLASMVAKNEPDLMVAMSAAGAIVPLVDFLRSDEEDRLQAGVIALNYLTDECPENAHAAYDAGVMPLLIEQLNSSVPGLRGAAASTLRHVCMEGEHYCEQFMRLGGIGGFVKQLDMVSGSVNDMEQADLMLEAVWNLEDVTTDNSGNLIKRYAKIANEQGALEKLERLRGVGDEEVSDAAQRVLAALARVG